MSKNELKLLIKNEYAILANKSKDKSLLAASFEGEIAEILRILQYYYADIVQEITLYQQQGVAVAWTGNNKIDFKGKNDINIQIGYLGNNPKKKIGIKQLTSLNNGKSYEIIKFINYNEQSGYGYLSWHLPIDEDRIIGYIRYLIDYNKVQDFPFKE